MAHPRKVPSSGGFTICDGPHGGWRFCRAFKRFAFCRDCWRYRRHYAREKELVAR